MTAAGERRQPPASTITRLDERTDLPFPELLRRWQAWMDVGGYSVKTRHVYRYHMILFWCDWCTLRGLEPMSAPEHEIIEYVHSLPPNGSKRGDAMKALKTWYRWAKGRHRDDDPTAGMKTPRWKVPLKPPDLSDDELRRLLRAAFQHSPRRGWAMLLCFATGARAESFISIEVRDVDLEDRYLVLRVTKNDRPYRCPLNRQGWIAAAHLLALAPLDPTARLLGVTTTGAFYQWVMHAGWKAGLDRRITPHMLRHAFSNRVALQGDPEAWRTAMNHADLSQWATYNRASQHRVRTAVDHARLRGTANC